MIRFDARLKVKVAVAPCDFRNGIDGIARLCEEILQTDPRSGQLFVFRNRSSTSAKMLYYDGRAFWLLQMRLSSGSFRVWPRSAKPDKTEISMMANDLMLLLGDGTPPASGRPWQPVGGLSNTDVEVKDSQKKARPRAHRDEREGL